MRVCVESCFTITAPRGPLVDGRSVLLSWPRSLVLVWVTARLPDDVPLVSVRHNYYGGASQIVFLEQTAANLGGVRWWFQCPDCGARVLRQHLPGRGAGANLFLCRRCHNLSYESAQDSRTRTRRLWLSLARQWGCSSRHARDTFRRCSTTRGAYLYEAKGVNFRER